MLGASTGRCNGVVGNVTVAGAVVIVVVVVVVIVDVASGAKSNSVDVFGSGCCCRSEPLADSGGGDSATCEVAAWPHSSYSR